MSLLTTQRSLKRTKNRKSFHIDLSRDDTFVIYARKSITKWYQRRITWSAMYAMKGSVRLLISSVRKVLVCLIKNKLTRKSKELMTSIGWSLTKAIIFTIDQTSMIVLRTICMEILCNQERKESIGKKKRNSQSLNNIINLCIPSKEHIPKARDKIQVTKTPLEAQQILILLQIFSIALLSLQVQVLK